MPLTASKPIVTATTAGKDSIQYEERVHICLHVYTHTYRLIETIVNPHFSHIRDITFFRPLSHRQVYRVKNKNRRTALSIK